MKKMLCMLLAMVMILAVFQVSFAEESAYKIAILTGTTTQTITSQPHSAALSAT